MGTTYEGRTLTLHWDDRQVVGRWCDGGELDAVPATPADDRVRWLVDLIGEYRRAYPGARVRATNRDGWREPVRGSLQHVVPQARRTPPAYVVRSPLEPLHYHVIPAQRQVKECWHRCAGVN
ncbi:hypothetical protein ABZ816_11085 [Actinosynnema sp. NPDC047251]|uniref:Uncharacterized protein n=1 Tax=Saccharothrix espanaensis (strain ATCC 51144 / DSM 44229 / JCM 9112 / NBRC 15066 / NRRL 15764) TaxID=1179773 RepID=K0K9Y5_SACES|nr:hypothetical protein [Saccharothrix espanaensis]CCH34362.1 hypothetical protein BN6_71270 [Saccharothrix espanaensis DSM 44229]